MRSNLRQVKRRKSNAVHIQHCTTAGTQARADVDNRPDILCGGKNLWLHDLTEQSCIVSLFSARYEFK